MKYDRTIVAYHGCDVETADSLLGGGSFQPSQNSYDWLGSGIYFWEYGVDRAMRFAEFQREQGKVATPTVVGALIQLGRCFDLMDTRFTSDLAEAFMLFSRATAQAQRRLPRNQGPLPDRKLRRLDCAVINFFLQYLADQGEVYDSVRCGFVEGPAAFPGSAIQRESHVQICIRNPACIVGVFRPMLWTRST